MMVAVPEITGVHWKTCSGALAVAVVQVPLRALVPEVVPEKVPPAAGITTGFPHEPGGSVVVEVEVVVVVMVVTDPS